jgi:transposase
MKRLNIGIDLALAAKHRASVYDPQTQQYLDNSFSFGSTFADFNYLLEQVNKHIPDNEEVQLNFIMEPTSLAWMPLSCFLIAHGHSVFRITTQKSHDLRKFLERHVSSDRVDAKGLAKAPEIDKKGIYELYLPPTDLGALTRKCKQMAKLIKDVGRHKMRIQSYFTMLNPTALDAFGEDKFTGAGRTFLKYFSNPFKIQNMGKEAFFKDFQEKSKKEIGEKTLKHIYEASISICKIYEPLYSNGVMPCDFDEVEDEIQREIRLMENLEEEIKDIKKSINKYYEKLDPLGILRTIQGVGERIAPAVMGLSGDLRRFSNIRKYKKFYGFVPKKKQSGKKEKKGQKICKAAQSLLKSYVYMAAETARRWDPEFAAFYNRLKNKGMIHVEAICALGNKMAGRIYAVLNRLQTKDNKNIDELEYKLRDLNGNVVSKKKARRIVLERFPSKAEREKSEKRNKMRKVDTNNRNKKERMPSQTAISRQSPTNRIGINSSQIKGNTLPAKTVIDNIRSGKYLQDPSLDEGQKELFSILVKLWDELPVDNLGKEGGKFSEKST